MSVEQLLIATRSEGKLRELRPLFDRVGLPIIDLRQAGLPPTPSEDDLEDADTFEANALAKARHFARFTGRSVVADDSGLEVMALGGRPGVHSRRWSGRSDLAGRGLDDANNARLMKELDGVLDRRARYVCAAAFCDGTTELVERGESAGTVTRTPRGTGGFGYDPFFESTELGRTFGEVSIAEKARVSHRARAFAKLLQRLTPRR